MTQEYTGQIEFGGTTFKIEAPTYATQLHAIDADLLPPMKDEVLEMRPVLREEFAEFVAAYAALVRRNWQQPELIDPVVRYTDRVGRQLAQPEDE